jgi:hypothetical protein
MLSRRDFLASLSALAGTSANINLIPKAVAQDHAPSDPDIRRELHKIFNKPFDIPDEVVSSTLDGIDANLNLLGLYRDLIGLLASPTDAAPMISALDETISAANASKGDVLALATKVESDGYPHNTDRYLNNASQALSTFHGPFAQSLASWASSSPDATLDIPLEIINDPKYLPIISLVCDPSSYGGGHTCPPAGEFLTNVSAAVDPLTLILLIAAAIFVIAILLILFFTDDQKAACEIAAEAIKATVDNKEIPDDQHTLENYTTVVKKARKDAGLSSEQLMEINKCVLEEHKKEKNVERQERLIKLSNAISNSMK